MVSPCRSEEQDLLDSNAVKGVRGGDSSAFGDIVKRYTPLLFSLSHRILGGDETAAEEAVQEIFAKAFRSLDRFDASRRFFTWFYTVALNHLRSFRRRQQGQARRRIVSFDRVATRYSVDRSPTPEQAALAREGERLVQEALALLPQKHREAFLLCEVEGMSAADAAEVLGVPQTTLRTYLFRARGKLKSILIEKEWE